MRSSDDNKLDCHSGSEQRRGARGDIRSTIDSIASKPLEKSKILPDGALSKSLNSVLIGEHQKRAAWAEEERELSEKILEVARRDLKMKTSS